MSTSTMSFVWLCMLLGVLELMENLLLDGFAFLSSEIIFKLL